MILAFVNNFFSSIASERYYYILGTVWLILAGVIIGCFGNKILSLLVLLTMCANLIYMAIYTVRDLKESDIDQIVTDINDQNPGGNIAFLHLHELTLGEMTYFSQMLLIMFAIRPSQFSLHMMSSHQIL